MRGPLPRQRADGRGPRPALGGPGHRRCPAKPLAGSNRMSFLSGRSVPSATPVALVAGPVACDPGPGLDRPRDKGPPYTGERFWEPRLPPPLAASLPGHPPAPHLRPPTPARLAYGPVQLDIRQATSPPHVLLGLVINDIRYGHAAVQAGGVEPSGKALSSPRAKGRWRSTEVIDALQGPELS